MNTIKKVLIFANGNVAVFDDQGHQVPELQEGFYNYAYANKLAKAILKNKPEVEQQADFFPLSDALNFYKVHPELIDLED